jgi:two-component system sensor histidine kinase DegS
LIEDTSRNPIFPKGFIDTEGIKTIFIIPLKSKDRVIGRLLVASHSLKEFSREENKLLTLIGIELVIAAEKTFFFKELQRVGKRFQEIFEKAHDAIWIQDKSGKVIMANQGVSRLTGYKLEELSGSNISQFFTPQALKLSSKVEQNLLLGHDTKQPYEQKIIKKDGKEASFMLTTSLLGSEKVPVFLNIARDITDEKKLQENLRLYASQINKAHEDERKRISRELHDDTIQTMLAISRSLDNIISKNSRLPEEALNPFKKIQKDIDESIMRIRRFIQYLRPPTLEYLGLIPALRELANQIQEQSGIKINFKASELDHYLSLEEELLVYRIVQEAIRNVWKHSQATEAEINIWLEKESIVVTINDNGKGFDIKKNTELLEKGKLGLMGMKERAHLIEGSLEIISKPKMGTKITLSIPIDH